VSVALVNQNVKRMRHIILACVACPSVSVLQHCVINGTISKKKVTEHKMYVFILSEISLIVRRIQGDTVINVHRSLCKVPDARVRF
jgi:hypothetical protein